MQETLTKDKEPQLCNQSLFQRVPALPGFSLQADLRPVVAVHGWPGYVAGEDLYTEIGTMLSDLRGEPTFSTRGGGEDHDRKESTVGRALNRNRPKGVLPKLRPAQEHGNRLAITEVTVMSTTYPKLQHIDAASEPTNLHSPALRALMDFYEGTGDLDGEESEVELMIQLSGMPGASVFAMDGE